MGEIRTQLITSKSTHSIHKKATVSTKSHTLSGLLCKEINLIENICRFLDAVNAEGQLHADFVHCGFEAKDMATKDAMAICGIVFEWVHAIKTAGKAKHAAIHLAKNYNMLAIVAEEDGSDLPVTDIINERFMQGIGKVVEGYHGKLDLQRQQEKGTTLEIFLSLE